MADKDKITSLDVTAANKPLCTKGSTLEYWDPVKNSFSKGYSVKYADGNTFSPRKLLLQDKSQRALLLSPDRRSTIVAYDTETGSPLRNLNVRLDMASGVEAPLDNIISRTKYGELKQASTLKISGLSGNRVLDLEWDPRVKEDTLVVTEANRTELTTRGHRFTSMVTTCDGHFATGSADGTVRLYSDIGKKAKTSLDQYSGSAVIGMDVSADGEWLLWTTAKFLALAKVGFQGGKGKTTGFETAMGKDKKPDALLIRIPDQDLEKMGITEDNISFTPARFDRSTSIGIAEVVEEHVITTTGPYVLQWKLRQLVNDYNNKRESNYQKSRPKIKKQETDIVDKVFEYGQTNKVVAALSDQVMTLDLEDEE